MYKIKRRHFLQLAASTLASLGWNQRDLMHLGNSYGRALASSNARKLALLVGIDKYDRNASGWIPLQGCVTDIYLQRELLINCFGFQPQDILLLSDRQATRNDILTAFEEHLIARAKPGDTVVFHYSGHGSRIDDPSSPDGFNGTIVPIDSPLPKDNRQPLKDITGRTLFLLTSALKTDRVTMVLDCCFAGGTTRGNLRIRSRLSDRSLQIATTEREYQQQWLSRLDLSPSEFEQRRQQGIAKGIAITSAQKNQLAADVSFDDFAAGAFTYALTQYLWQRGQTSFITPTIAHTQKAIAQVAPGSIQEPKVEIAPDLDPSPYLVYFLNKQIPAAEAVITEIQANDVKLWLGGIDARSIAAFNSGATFSAIDLQENQIATVRLESRQGLIGYGKLASNPQQSLSRGSLLQEEIRSIPRNLKLVIGIDAIDSLQGREIKRTFAQFPQIKVVSLQTEAIDYIFDRLTLETEQKPTTIEPTLNSWGLFYPDLTIVPDSFSHSEETVVAAVKRLTGRLKSLLAVKSIRLALNASTSRLKVTAKLYGGDRYKQTLAAFNTRSNPQENRTDSQISQIPSGTPLQIEIANQEDRPLHINVLAIDSAGKIAVIFPNHWTKLAVQSIVAPQQTITIPEPSTFGFELRSSRPLGFTEVLVIASTIPLQNSLAKLEQIALRNRVSRGSMMLRQPWEVVENLVTEFDSHTRQLIYRTKSDRSQLNNYLINNTQLAILSIGFATI